MATKIVISELDIDVNALIKSTAEVKNAIDVIKKQQADLTKQGETASHQFVQNAADLKTLSSAYNSNLKAISESTQATADQANRTQLLTLALESEVVSIKEARDQNALLNKLRNEANATTEEGQQEIAKLNAKLDQNNEFIKENADAYLKQKINIGNYSESIKDALSNLNPLNGGIGSFIERSQQAGGVGNLLTASLKGITTGIIGMTRASLAFLATPIGAVIGAIGVVLGLVINYLKSTQSGIDAVTSVTRPLQAIMTSLMSVLNAVGKALFDAFSNPKKLLTDLADFVKTNLINRFKAFGVILEGIIELDFKKVTNGVLQAGTGVENMTDKIQAGAKATGEFLDDAIKKGQQIDALKKDIERSELAYQRAQIKTNDLIDEQLLISKDTSKSFAERGKASEEIIRLTEILSKQEEDIIQKKIKALQLEYSLKDAKELTIAEQQAMIDLEKQLDEAQDRGLNARLEQTRVLSGLKKEQQAEAKAQADAEAERRQKELDDIAKKAQAELELFLSKQGIKAKSLEEELKLAEDIYQKQLEINQKEYNASEKSAIDKLNLQTKNNEATNEYLQKQSDLVISNLDRELELFIQNNQSKLDANKFLTDELVRQEKERLELINNERIDAERVRLEQGVINQQQYNDVINGINAENKAKIDELEAQRKEAEAQKQLIDLENKRAYEDLIFREDFDIKLQRLEEERQAQLKSVEKTGADIEKINKLYDARARELNKQQQLSKVDSFQNALSQIGGLLNAFGVKNKNLAIALATADAFLSSTKAYGSQLVIGDPTSLPRAIGAGAMALASGIANVAQIAKTDTKFEQGGIVEIGGKRHSAGGTKFWGEDGTSFEAERGEGIGILNRNAFASFMDLNNRYPSGKSTPTFMQGGGIITQGVNNNNFNIDAFVNGLIQANQTLPRPVVFVEDINSGQNNYADVVNGASF